jgi:hypothetical protein
MSRKLRRLGQITSDQEAILEEMIDGHDMQCGEVLALVYNWIRVHRPSAIEEYEDGTGSPEFYYGPKD